MQEWLISECHREVIVFLQFNILFTVVPENLLFNVIKPNWTSWNLNLKKEHIWFWEETWWTDGHYKAMQLAQLNSFVMCCVCSHVHSMFIMPLDGLCVCVFIHVNWQTSVWLILLDHSLFPPLYLPHPCVRLS